MMKLKSKKEYTARVLFAISVTLVFITLLATLTFKKSNAPSVRSGATISEVDNFAYELSGAGNVEANPKGYLAAVDYYDSQISLSTDNEQQFNLELSLASFLGESGDPDAGLEVLGRINSSELPPDAIYYLYTTYSYLYQRKGDSETAMSCRERIIDEGIYDYVASLDLDGEPTDLGEEAEEEYDE